MQREMTPWVVTARDFFDGCDRVRALFAELIAADEPERIAIVPAVSYGLATVARNTRLERGQNVVTVQGQFPSNVHVWHRLCAEAGAELRSLGAPAEGPGRAAAWSEAIADAIDPATAIVAMGTVLWSDGTRFDLDSIGCRAREMGAALVVDGTQSLGADPFDVKRVQPDALVCAGYKWLTGPYSVGVAYYGPRYDGGTPLEETWAGRLGSDDFAGLVAPSEDYRPGAVRYDMGEAAGFTLVPMLVAALEQIREWGVTRIRSYVVELARAALEDPRLDDLGVIADPAAASHVFGMRLPGHVDPRRAQAMLRDADVHVSLRGPVIRVSPHVYNDREDVDALLAGLAAVVG
jgi:selenocysteine lyase/cysteine desulfurase